MPWVFVGQENGLEVDSVQAFITATNLVECVPLVEAVVVIVDGRGIVSDLKLDSVQ